MATEVKDETLTAENVQVNLKTLYIALHGHGLSRDIARQRIVWAVQEGLDPEGKAKLEEEERENDPCCNKDIKPVDFLIEKELADLKAMREASRVRG